MLDLARPWALLAPLLAALALLRGSRSRGRIPVSGPWVSAAAAAAGWIDRIPAVLRAAAVLALACAAAGPVRVGGGGAPPSGVAVMLVLDVSPSMGEELTGGRTKLEAARGETLRFLERRPGDAAGLVIFGREALVRVPPSLDREGILAALDAAEPGGLGEGTALGTALGLAADRLRAVDMPSRVIVLLTDGEGNAGALDPITAARAAAALGARLHVVDVSNRTEARAALAHLAAAGNGLHRPADDPAGVDRAYRDIDALEPAPFPDAERRAGIPLDAPLLWAALLLVAAERALRGSRWGTLP